GADGGHGHAQPPFRSSRLIGAERQPTSDCRQSLQQSPQIDTTTASGRMVFGIFATLAEFERDLIRERTMAGLASARARGRKGGRKFALTKAQVRLAQAAMAQRDTSVSDLCKELGIERVTLYRYVGPKGELRDHGKHVLGLT
ncbi:recombinase family protein, partial [Pseudomonas aeruginosa]|uniref:recombinase family protein n=1 Tax=Pseudomonas aeruginosa TaxID=287 RepID=UPI002739D440